MPNKDIPIKERLLAEFDEKFSMFYEGKVRSGDFTAFVGKIPLEELKSFLSQSVDRLLTEVERRVEAEKRPEFSLEPQKSQSLIRNSTLNLVINIIAELKK